MVRTNTWCRQITVDDDDYMICIYARTEDAGA